MSPASLPAALQRWRTPFAMLFLMAIALELGFAAWRGTLYNFAEEIGGLNGADIGLQQTIREIPGFLAFAVVFVLLAVREQTLALVSLAVMGLGVAVTGYFPTLTGLLITTFIMSMGFHYFSAVDTSLQLQWLPKATAPRQMGTILAAASFGQLIVYGLIGLLWHYWHWPYHVLFTVFGGLTLALTVFMAWWFPRFPEQVVQHKKIVLRRRYWLYYLLTFFAGARRQIFVVFAAWLMIEKFGFEVDAIALLFLINITINMVLAPRVGALIGRFGERRALIFEYGGLIVIFTAYAFVSDATLAAVLYVTDHIFFALAIAMRTYLQKIADPADMAPTASVSSTINHIAAVGIPVTFGLIWLYSPTAVFLLGTGIAACSLVLSALVPRHPAPGHETVLVRAPAPAQ